MQYTPAETKSNKLFDSATNAIVVGALMVLTPPSSTIQSNVTVQPPTRTQHVDAISGAQVSFFANEARRRKSYRQRYKNISNSQWFKDAYHNKSMGDVTLIDA